MKIVTLLALTIGTFIVEGSGGKVLTCYVMSWSAYRPAEGEFHMDYIDPYLCTHIIYAYSSVNDSDWQIVSENKWSDYGIGNINKLVGLKKENPDLKILTSVGGWSMGSEKFSNLVEELERRKTFIDSVMNYLDENKFDGLDIDWQHPTKRGGKPEDKKNFVFFLEELKKEFKKKDYILTVRLGSSNFESEGYDLPGISAAVDFINFESYAYNGVWDAQSDVYASLQNVISSIKHFLESGVSNEKLLLGLSTESSAYILDDKVTNGKYFGQRFSKGTTGPWIGEEGLMGYNEICWELTRNKEWTDHWDANTSTPYATKGNILVSYENKQSFLEKLSLVRSESLAGVSIYSLDKDDFRGHCYDEKFVQTYTVKTFLASFKFKVTIINQSFP